MTRSPIAIVMVHVGDVDAALTWYARAFPAARRVRVAHPKASDGLEMGGVRLECVPADPKVAAGPAGSVVYWRVPQFEPALAHLLAQGAVLYRGPMAIEDGQRMCQVRDPWGNCIGLHGPAVA